MNDRENEYLLIMMNFWDNKNFYIKLMEKFVEEDGDCRDFKNQYCEKWNRDHDRNFYTERTMEVLDKVSFLMINIDLSTLNGFYELLAKLFNDTIAFEPDPAIGIKRGTSEKKLRKSIEKTLKKIKRSYS